MNKYFFFLSILILIFFSGCNAEENLAEEEDLASQLEGEWHCRNIDITLRFDDGKTQHVAKNFNTGESVLSFEVNRIEKGYISGAITNNGIFGNSSGTWSYDFADEEGFLAIIFHSENPVVYKFRHLEFPTSDQMKMTLSDGLLLEEYHVNGLSTGSGPKLTGGNVLEIYEKR
ncbi:MAG: hypothetical protein KBF57_01810 [Saprospiraceae bacterium]|jgi:hypothetical protein|nr:hypothetical protein [Saprospiraceae bacterium]MBP9193390.1 hypothetical protein [Saprospiraceae bacterium]